MAIPVFQFGIFSDTDLSFFAGPNFDFGGRVHTNGNLWLSEGDGATLTMRDKITAVGQVIRTNLENGWPVTTSYNGAVSITQNPGSGPFVALAQNQGSTTGTSFFGSIGATQNSVFQNVSNSYNGNVGDGATGVKTRNPRHLARHRNASIGNGGRNATTTTYRMAIVGGKTIPFKQPPAGTGGLANGKSDFGTDGGVHNFLRYLENWGGQTLWTRDRLWPFSTATRPRARSSVVTRCTARRPAVTASRQSS